MMIALMPAVVPLAARCQSVSQSASSLAAADYRTGCYLYSTVRVVRRLFFDWWTVSYAYRTKTYSSIILIAYSSSSSLSTKKQREALYIRCPFIAVECPLFARKGELFCLVRGVMLQGIRVPSQAEDWSMDAELSA